MKRITFIGAGNMATSIIGGLLQQGYDANAVTATDPSEDTLKRIADSFSINTTQDNLQACQNAEVIILAVKPQVLKTVCMALAPALDHQPLVISIAAGITVSQLDRWLANDLPLVRCMPNTPALVQLGATGLYANNRVTTEHKASTEKLLGAMGIVTWLEDELLLDAVTAVSGSAPAYFFLLMEAMINAGVQQGLSQQQATELTLQTAAGAAKLAQTSDVNVAELRRRVTSPGGTTEQAILTFEEHNFQQIVADAMDACAKRAATMTKEFN